MELPSTAPERSAAFSRTSVRLRIAAISYTSAWQSFRSFRMAFECRFDFVGPGREGGEVDPVGAGDASGVGIAPPIAAAARAIGPVDEAGARQVVLNLGYCAGLQTQVVGDLALGHPDHGRPVARGEVVGPRLSRDAAHVGDVAALRSEKLSATALISSMSRRALWFRPPSRPVQASAASRAMACSGRSLRQPEGLGPRGVWAPPGAGGSVLV